MSKFHPIKKKHYQRYLKAYNSAAYFLGQQDAELNLYTQRFNESLPEDFSVISNNIIGNEIASNDINLVGDFHTCKYSQKSFINLLKIAIENNSDTKLIIALEMFEKKYNRLIADYQAGLLSEGLFLELSSYSKNWGFSWLNYKPIFSFAKKNNIKIYGIDSGDKKFLNRDLEIAKNIVSILDQNPESKIFTLIGECHLAPSHLPQKIKEVSNYSGLKVNRILQNMDQYYFSLFEKNIINPDSCTLKLSSDLFCVFNAPTWKKWESVQNWFERIDEDEYLLDDDAA